MKQCWERKSLSDLLVVASGQVDPTVAPFADMPHVGGDNVESHTGRIVNVSTPRKLGMTSGKYAFSTDDLLYSKIRPNLNKVAVPDFAGVCSADIYPLRPKPDAACREFLAYLLRSDDFLAYAEKHSARTNIPKLNREALLAYAAIVPPLSEQKRIAAILDKADALRRKRQQALQLTEQFLRSTFLDMFGDPVRNPKGWRVGQVSDAGEVQLGRQRAPKYQTGKYTTPYMRVANVFEDRIDLSDVLSMDFDEADRARYELQFGDILLNEGQSTELVGRPAMWREEIPGCCFQNTLVRFRPTPHKTDPEFALAVFLHYLHSGEFAKVSSKTSNVAHLGASRFAAMRFPLPSFDLQERFGAIVHRARILETVQERNGDHVGCLFHSLVQRAFRGEL